MKAVILVGGEGTRLRPLTYNRPKAMVPIVNRPFLEHTVNYLKEHQVGDIILALGYLPDRIQNHFGDAGRFGVRLIYQVEDSPLGTAGAVKKAAQYLDDTFFVLNGDIFTDLDLTAMLEAHREKGAKATIALTPVDDPTLYGVVETDAQGRVRRFIEKPSWDAVTTNMVNAGVYVLEPEVLDYIPANSYYMFEHGLFPNLLRRGEPIYGYPFSEYWIDMGTPEKYLKLHHDLLAGGEESRVGEGCTIHPTAQLVGQVVIDRNCTIGKGVQLRGPVVLGEGCSIGENTVIEGAVLWQNVRIGAGVRLRNCVVAADSLVGDGCWVLDGCMLGEGVTILYGNRLGHGARIWPGKTLEPETISF